VSVFRQFGLGTVNINPRPKHEAPDPPPPPPPRLPFGTARQKSQRWESSAYQRLVASLPCAICGVEGRSQAAHANSYLLDKSKGKKAPDWALFPLCAPAPGVVGCHAQLDQHQTGVHRDDRVHHEHALIVSTFRRLLERNLLLLAKP
jgi:hypothetical protein